MPYGIPETQNTLRKNINASLQMIYKNNNNSLQKNSLVRSTQSPVGISNLGIFNSVKSTEKATDNVTEITQTENDISLNIQSGSNYYKIIITRPIVNFIFVGQPIQQGFDFTLELDFSVGLGTSTDSNGNIITNQPTFPQGVIFTHVIDSAQNSKEVIKLSTLDRGVNWIVTNAEGFSSVAVLLDDVNDFISNFKTDPVGTVNALSQNIIDGANDWWETNFSTQFNDFKIWYDNNFLAVNEWFADQSQAVLDVLGTSYTTLQEWYGQVNDIVTELFENPATFINNRITQIITNLKNLFKDDRGVLGSFYEGLFDDTLDSSGINNPTPRNTENNLFRGIGNGVNTIGNFFADVTNDTPSIIRKIIDSIFGVGTEIVNNISTVLFGGSFTNTMRTALKKIGEFFNNSNNIGRKIIDSIFGVGKTAVQWLVDQGNVIGNIPTIITDIFKNDRGGLGAFYEGLFNDTLDSSGINNPTSNTTINNIMRSIGNGLRSTWEGIKSWYNTFNAASRTAIEKVGGFFSDISDIGQKIKDDIFGVDTSPQKFTKTQISSSITSTDAGTIGKKINDENISLVKLIVNSVSGVSVIGETLSDIISKIGDQIIHKGENNDIDLGTYDLQNVDRIFFKSNDSIDPSSIHPHITGFGSNNSNKSLLHFVRSGGHQFFIGNGSPVLTLNNNEIITSTKISCDKKIKVGADRVRSNGDIALNSSGDILFRSNNKTFNASNIVDSDSVNFGSFENSIVPKKTKTVSLGSSTKLWRGVTTRSLLTDIIGGITDSEIDVRADLKLASGHQIEFSAKTQKTIIPFSPDGFIQIAITGETGAKFLPYYNA